MKEVAATFDQIIKVLGFHDQTSFFMTAIFVLLALAFIASSAVFLVKKRKERLQELNKIVAEVQKLVEPEEEQKPVATVDTVLKEQDVGVRSTEASIEKPEVLVKQPKEKKKKSVKKKPPISESAEPLKVTLEALVKSDIPAPVKKDAEEATGRAGPSQEPTPIEAIKPPTDSRHQLGAALSTTRGGFMAKLAKLFSRGHEVSDEDFEELETILFTADIGAKTAQKLLDTLRERVAKEKNANKDFLRTVLKEEICRIFESAHRENGHDQSSPQVMMFVGVNGAGKTTSIGKLGAQLKNSGKKVLFGAGDTFRAAATLQLSVWGERVGADVVAGKENSDSASVLFEAIEKGKKDQVDVVLCDTAGRLHTKTSLMDELKKVHRVVGKAKVGAPHEVFLVIDATMGQNAISQAREFAAATPLTGVVLSKLDGTAKGGVAIGIVDELKVPIRYIGIGEQVTDLKDFDPKMFVDALFEEA